MNISKARRNAIYDRTSGYCHLCGKKVARSNYGRYGARGAWEVEHSLARVRGGTDRLCNLYVACVSCNRSKQCSSTRSARRKNGRTRAPLSVTRRKSARIENAIAGAGLGLLAGGWLGGIGAVAGSVLGALFGHSQNPDRIR